MLVKLKRRISAMTLALIKQYLMSKLSELFLYTTTYLNFYAHDNSKKNESNNLKLEEILGYGTYSGDVLSRTISWRDFEFFLHLPQYNLSIPISQLWHRLGSCD